MAAKAKTSDDLIQSMRDAYPDVMDVLDNFILVESAKVGVGENPPWKE